MNDHRVDAVLIATRHDSHASLVCDALAAGKAVFVEKPLAITLRELARVEKGLQAPGARLLVGFNRRFAPLSEALRRHFAGNENRLVIQYRINAGYLPPDDWTQVPAIGGGRIVGEACHFVDWISYLTDSMPVAVYAAQRHGARDEVLITLTMENGSLAVITYVAGGSPAQPKERIEVFGAGKSAVLEDWRWADLMSGAKRKRIRKPGKGHQEELAAWVTGLQHGAAMPITPASLLRTTAATLAVERSLTERRAIDLIQERGMDSPPANAPVVLL